MQEKKKSTEAAEQEKGVKRWRGRISKSRKARKELEEKWKENVAFRVMKPFKEESDQDRVATPDDWSRTRAKIASLFSAVPTINTTPLHPRYSAAAPQMGRVINHVLKHQAKPHVIMRECMPDLVNAAGVCGAIALYEATFEDVEVPAIDLSAMPPAQAALMLAAKQVPMEKAKRAVSERFVLRRLSPNELLWPAEFKTSDFNDADWVGRDGVLPWPVAKREFKLTGEDKEKIAGDQKLETLADDESGDQIAEMAVRFQEIFYWAARFDENELNLEKIRRIVFVDGIDDRAVVDEDYAGQAYDEQSGNYVGVCIFPIQICTIAYVTDKAVPPSDSEIGRPSVLERMRGRAQIVQNRDLSKPMRWVDVSRLDPAVAERIEKGDWQAVIPMNGPGERAFGEVSRANYPREDFEFDRVVTNDLDEAWSLSKPQMGAFNPGARSASEVQAVQSATNERIGLERAQVVSFFLNLVEVLAGLIQLYYDEQDMEPIVGPDGVEQLQQWDRSLISGKFVFSITQDSTVLLESGQKIEKLMKALNLVGKSGFVNPEPIIAEILSLSGINPADVMTKPEPPKPEMPSISLRLTGATDLINPIAMGLLMKSGQAPTPQELSAAIKLIQDAMSGMTGAPAAPEMGMTQPESGQEQAPAPSSEWGPAERVTKRVDELGG